MNKEYEQLNLFISPKNVLEPIIGQKGASKPRLNSPARNQVEFINSAIDDLVAEDHQVRNIWNYVSQIDLTPILQKIKSTDNNPGRPAIDPKILLSLWIYAISEGIGSARVIDRYVTEHLAFRWLCGGVSVNYHSISDFRRLNAEEFDELISMTIARLLAKDLITLQQVSQDGMRVRASAGSSSFRRKPSLKKHYEDAKKQVEILRKEIDDDPSISLNRSQAAKKRAAEERKIRLEQAISEHKKLMIEKGKAKKKQRKPFTQDEKDEIRSSTSDPEARKMKMGNGGFCPAYNFQIAIDTESRFIVSSYVINKNNDYGQLPIMNEQIVNRFKKIPERHLVDQGYLEKTDIIKVQKSGSKVYVNPKEKRKHEKQDAYEIHKNEHEELGEWRVRMGTEEAKEIYKDRASNSEWANAGMRNRGLQRLLVRGLNNVSSVLSLYTITHNMLRAIKLNYAW
jgi:transposase